jgi:hypothetical protein
VIAYLNRLTAKSKIGLFVLHFILSSVTDNVQQLALIIVLVVEKDECPHAFVDAV